MRLTVDVILRAQITINPLKERELNLRGYKVPAIENLGVTKDGFDCIDLSDNEIKKLENFPRLRRLRMLLLNNNHISRIHENLAESVEGLEYLILAGNRIAQLAELDHLVAFTKLDTLSLIGNPVTKRRYYRQYVINKLPQLRVLDFQKIRPHEREAASVFFNSLAGKRIEEEATGESNGIQPPQVPGNAPPPPPPPVQNVTASRPREAPAQRLPSSPQRATNEGRDSQTSDATGARGAHASPIKRTLTEASVESSPSKRAQTKPELATPQKAGKQDVEMEEAPYTPSKPIEQLTVNQLREALKEKGLSTKGLKAELVKRLKDAVGNA